MRWGRILFMIVIGLAALIILALALAPSLLNLEHIKEQIVNRVEQQINRDVELGQVRLAFFSGLGAGLDKLTIANPKGWQSPYFVKVDTLSVKVALRPLLNRRIEVSNIILKAGEIVVERDAQGRFNYDDLIAGSADSTTPTEPAQPGTPEASKAPDGPSPLAGLLVSKLALNHVDIKFMDQMVVAGKTVTTAVQRVDLEADNIGFNTPIAFHLSSALLRDGEPNLQISGQIGPVPDHANIDLQHIPLQLALDTTDLPLAPVAPYLGDPPMLTDGVLGANIAVQGTLGDALHIQGQLALSKAVMPDATQPGQPMALPPVTLTHDVTIHFASAHLTITEAQADIGALQTTLTGTVQPFDDPSPQLDLKLHTSNVAIADVINQWPMLTDNLPQPAEVQGDLQVQATLQGTPHQLHTDARITAQTWSLKSGSFHGGEAAKGGMRIDLAQMQTRLKAQLNAADPPTLHIDLDAKHLAFDRQSASAPAAAPSPGQTPPAAPPADPPASQVPPIHARGNITIAGGSITGIAFQNLNAAFSIIEGLVKSQQTVQLFDGTYQGTLSADLAQAKPDYQLTMKLANIQAGDVANAFTSTPNIVFGQLNTDLNFSGKGLDWNDINTTLSGTGKLHVANFKLTTLDIMPKLATGLTVVSTIAGFTVPDDLSTRSFDQIKATLHVQDGNIRSDDLELWGPDVQLLGKGSVGLDRSLAFDGTAILMGKLATSLGQQAKFLLDPAGHIHIPLMIEGTVTQPRMALNETYLTDLAQRALTQQVKEKGGKELEEVLNRALKGLFNR